MTSSSVPPNTLRLICTTDLHMAIDGTRLLTGEVEEAGLAALSPAISAARAQVAHSLLFDIGDAFQGSPLTDDLDSETPHPMQGAFNLIGYDGQTIGNHDLDFGIDALRHMQKTATAPIVCANLLSLEGEPLFDPYRILTIPFGDDILRVGITGILPPRVMRWNRHHLHRHAQMRDSAEAVRAVLPELRAGGADIVIVLAHCGIVPLGHDELDEQAALPIAMLDGVDAVLCGHQHRVFPGPDFPHADGIDPILGTLDGTPAIMAGWAGQRIGVLDLTLKQDRNGWSVGGHRASFRLPHTNPDARITTLVAPHISRARVRLDAPISHTDHPIDTKFAAIAHSPAVRLVQAALLSAGRRAVTTDLPILAVASPLRCGGRAGPSGYTNIPSGPLNNRAVADLSPYPNRIIAAEVTGAQMIDWLEMASLHLGHISPQRAGQPLVNLEMPAYNFDAALGLNYVIDPTQPYRFSTSGKLMNIAARRITQVTHNGAPLDPTDRFVVIANSYRIAGGGNFPGMSDLNIINDNIGGMGELIAEWLRDHPNGITLPPPAWQIRPAVPVEVSYRTGSGHPDPAEVFPHVFRPAGKTADGWFDWDISLSAAGA